MECPNSSGLFTPSLIFFVQSCHMKINTTQFCVDHVYTPTPILSAFIISFWTGSIFCLILRLSNGIKRVVWLFSSRWNYLCSCSWTEDFIFNFQSLHFGWQLRLSVLTMTRKGKKGGKKCVGLCKVSEFKFFLWDDGLKNIYEKTDLVCKGL